MTEIVVQLNLELEGRTLAEVEAEVMAQLRAGLAPALGAEIAALGEELGLGACGVCGGRLRGRGAEDRRVVGLFGAMRVRRRRGECVRCQRSVYPLDERLGLDPQETYTLGVAEASLWLATETSYAKAAATTDQLLGVGISHGQVHHLAQREGRLIEAAWEELRGAIFAKGDREAVRALDGDGSVPDLVVIQADGTFVHNRATGEGMEAKGGIVYSGVAEISKGRRRLLNKGTYAGVEEITAFAEKLSLLAASKGAFRARQLWFVSDGSAALRKMQQDYFPSAVAFLDVWHLEKRLTEALGEAASREHLGRLLGWVTRGDVDALVTDLVELWATAAEDDELRTRLARLLEYVDANRSGIAAYARFGPQASSPIEKCMDVTIGRRLKARGTSWYPRGAHHLLHLRVLKQNGAWNRYWQARRSRTPLTAALVA